MAEIRNPNTAAALAINSDGEAPVALTRDESKAGFSVTAGEAHDGAAGLGRVVRPIDVSHDYRTRVGVDGWEFVDNPSHSSSGVLNRYLYSAIASTYVSVNAAGWFSMNSGLSVATGAYFRLQTFREFSVGPSLQKYSDVAFRLSNALPASGQIIRIGRIRQAASVSTLPEDGACLERTAAGAWIAALYYNGALAISVDIGAYWTPVLNKTHLLLISESMYRVDWYIDDVLCASIPRPDGQADNAVSGAAPLCALIAANATVANACVLSIGKWGITNGDGFDGLDYVTRCVLGGRSAHSANGGQGASTDNYANSAAPAAATLSNTTAGYATPGGAFRWVAVAGAETDYALFAYQAPAGSSTQRPRTMLVQGIDISVINNGAANSATVPTVIQWWLGVGSTAVSLATTDGAGTRAPRRRFLGTTVIPVNAVVGQDANKEVHIAFPNPETVEPGTYLHVIARIVVGAATASQEIRGVAQVAKVWAE